jgi:acyl transferase domain-containing protein
MDAILEEFAAAARTVEFCAPRLPYASSVTGRWIDGGVSQVAEPDETMSSAHDRRLEIASADYWVRHLRAQVRFGDAVACLLEQPDTALVEIGPGNALSTFARMSPAAPPDLVAVQSLPRAWENKEGEDQTIAASIGRLWESGAAIDWEAYRRGQARRLVPLPNTPFERRRCWIDLPADATPAHAVQAARRQPDPADWFHVPGWRRVAPLAAATTGGEAARTLALLAPSRESAIVTGLVRALEEAGWTVQVIPPEPEERLVAQFVAAQDPSAGPAIVLHARSLGTEADAAQAMGHASLCRIGHLLGAMPERPVDIVILAEEIHAVTGTEDLDPERALLLGPAKVIAQEFPHLHTHLLDVEREQASFVVGQVVAAMAAVERPALQAFRGGQRWLPEIVPLRIEGAG